ncbi:sigma factor-like helix-turn-helix DNA-binding protein [Sphingopyxis sp. MWB1]|uniref:sigma factor-like helix-turn-helix DNA-binding protein n=1 Tax=Sphingopyxis sp. MWB1 TaxID=1537715 RepID=UPI00051A0742|nr:sigma factor-like helix-turn-helix DNA-binding protein [Sphingopyxis sp. MWB1]
MRRRDLSTVTIEDLERRLVIALAKMSARQADIFLSIRFDRTSYEELAARHGVTLGQVTTDFARALRIWSRCLHARFPSLVWPWL